MDMDLYQRIKEAIIHAPKCPDAIGGVCPSCAAQIATEVIEGIR